MEKIGHYELHKIEKNFLGNGSFSDVYLGKYTGSSTRYIKNNTNVAIKIINIKNVSSKSIKIVNDEIDIMIMIKDDPHPNIVECYDVIKKNDYVYIIMEFCDSGNLRNILKKPIKEKYAQFYFLQLANGLKYLDKNNIIHRDIKPKNILLTNSRRILKIADFGFARKSKDQSLYDTICGSPLYMAPEIMGNNYYNKQTDLWSIGMILFEMLYGFHPFHNCKTIPELKLSADKKIDIPPHNTQNKDLSNECISLLMILLQKDVINRITWEDFFNHPWLNLYQYVIPKTERENEEYEKQICSASIGSLSKDEYLDINDIIENNEQKLQIIHDYYDDSKNKEYEEDIFHFEQENDSNIVIKEIMENSSCLEKIDETSHKYDIINHD